jgi:hypothetical protein
MFGAIYSKQDLTSGYWLSAAFLAVAGFVYLISPLFPSANGSAYLIAHGLMTVIMLVVWQGNSLNLNTLLWVGITARILLIGTPVFTTHDVERYLWDGAVVLQGFDPFVTSPDDPLVADLRAYWPTPEENAKYPTIYPPGSLLLFAFSALFGPTVGIYVWKLIVVGAGVATLFVAANLFKRLDVERHFALIALSPLLILESGVGGHIDSVTALMVLLSVQFFMDKRFGLAGAVIGLATSVKLFPIIFLAPMIGNLGLARLKRQHLVLVFGALVSIALIYGSALLAGYESVGVLGTFLKKWRFGSPLHLLIEGYFEGNHQIIVSIGLAIFLTIGVLVIAHRDFASGMLAMGAALFLVSPVVYPWYLMMLVPFAAMRPSAFMLVWLSLVPLSYEVIDRYNDIGIWAPLLWPVYMVAIGWVVGGLLDATRQFLGRSSLTALKTTRMLSRV